jgi:hypothetical protein
MQYIFKTSLANSSILKLFRLIQTVNTAARMESNGEPNKIHVSQATAELLKTGGKRYVA